MRNKIDLFATFDKLGIKLNNKQQEIVESVEQNQMTIVRGTRRGGKSFVSAGINAALMLNPGQKCGLTAPSLKLTEIIFRQTVENLTNTLMLKPSVLNNKDRILTFPWQSELLATSLRNRKQILGRSYDIFNIDEAAVADEPSISFLFIEIIPTLLEYDGHLFVISTPRGQNYFYELSEYARKEPKGKSIKYTIYDQTHIPLDAVEAMKKTYLDLGMEKYWMQEFEVEWISLDGSVFEFYPHEVNLGNPLRDFADKPEGDYFIGIDPGSRNFGAVLVCVNADGIFIVDCFNASNKSTVFVAEKLKQWEENYNITEMYTDSAAAQTRVDLAQLHHLSFRNSNKDIDAGLNSIRLFKDRIFINTQAQDADLFVKQWSLYSYNEQTGKPKKRDDHMLDALRYVVHTALSDRLIEIQEGVIYGTTEIFKGSSDF